MDNKKREFYQKVGKQIQGLRTARELSREKFSNVAGISTYDVQCYEKGKKEPCPMVLLKILNILGGRFKMEKEIEIVVGKT